MKRILRLIGLFAFLFAVALSGRFAARFHIAHAKGTPSYTPSPELRLVVSKVVKAGLLKRKKDSGNFPSTEEGLDALFSQPIGSTEVWRGPYVDDVWREYFRDFVSYERIAPNGYVLGYKNAPRLTRR